jgi:hypothetical protein
VKRMFNGKAKYWRNQKSIKRLKSFPSQKPALFRSQSLSQALIMAQTKLLWIKPISSSLASITQTSMKPSGIVSQEVLFIKILNKLATTLPNITKIRTSLICKKRATLFRIPTKAKQKTKESSTTKKITNKTCSSTQKTSKLKKLC